MLLAKVWRGVSGLAATTIEKSVGQELTKRIYLHMGLQKTGTSSIQVMLASSGKALEDFGYFFPNLPVPQTERSSVWTSPFRHNCLAATYADFHSTFQPLTAPEHTVLMGAMRSSKYDPILSAEEFSRQVDFSRIARGLAGFELVVLIYLRRQDRYMESLYNQRNKILVSRCDTSFLGDSILTIDDMRQFIQVSGYDKIMNFHYLLKRIENDLKPISIYVRDFNRLSLRGGDVCDDFCSLINVDIDQMSRPRTEANQSIGNHVIASINDTFMSSGREAAKEMMSEINLRMSQGEDFSGDYKILSDGDRRSLLDEYANQNDELKRDFGVSFY